MSFKHHKQMSESFLTAAFLSVSGGLQDAYTYIFRGKVFANAQTGNMLHQLFMFFVSFLPDGKSGHHCSQRRGHRTVKSSHTAASGYRITTGYFI